jgi:hypothetical protein
VSDIRYPFRLRSWARSRRNSSRLISEIFSMLPFVTKRSTNEPRSISATGGSSFARPLRRWRRASSGIRRCEIAALDQTAHIKIYSL